ncbi:MAG: 50S ribosomal protein L20 [Bacteroidetes bacterium]|nr:50S ribosomal protein L20 [Bacteroidota bacterium]
MPRSVNHVASRARRKKILSFAKGYWGRRKNVWTVAKNAVEKGWTYAYRDRRTKKRNFRALWIQRINAATRTHGMSYSKFMDLFHKANLQLNRKVLADLAMNHPEAFKSVVDFVQNPSTQTKKANKATKKEVLSNEETPKKKVAVKKSTLTASADETATSNAEIKTEDTSENTKTEE